MSAETFHAPSLEHLAELLPAYDFDAFIAQGGMGAVYKARQRSLDRDVAIKILPRELGADPEFRQSFETEAKAMARLNHPNLIGVYDYGDVDGMPYIVMEYVNGKSLFHSAYHTAIDPVQAVTIVKGICDGLAHAHENGVIHRDIKPANILLTPKAEPKIGDFGLARPAGADSSGIVMGTPGYAAPEITRHPDHADRRSDLFALGVVLYELLIGRCPPYDYQPPPSTVVGCDPALDRICEKAAHPVADLRYPSAEAMSAALEEWLRKAAAGVGTGHQVAAPAGRKIRRVGGAVQHSSYEPVESGSGGMVKGLVMTAVAIVIGAIGWGKYKDAETAKAAAIQAANAASQPAQSQKPAPDKAAKPALPVKPEPEKVVEAPLKSLERLKADLAAGRRGEMPAGSIALEGSDIFIVPTPMTWPAASAFAESHGAHLFVVTADKDLDRLAAMVPSATDGADPGLWLGVGRVGKESWASINGTDWAASSKPVGPGTYAVLDGNGVVKAREAVDRYPFIIQWEKDGSNPASVKAILGRTGKSLTAGKPAFPPGTVEFEGNLVYVAPQTTTSAEAEELAKTAGGHLVVVGSEEKDAWLDDLLSPFSGDRGFWIGAKKEEDKWQWSTSAAWNFTHWADADQEEGMGTRVTMIPGEGWRNSYRDDPAAGFIVEWSYSGGSGSGGSAAPVDVPLTLPPAIVELEAKAKNLLAGHDKKRQTELAKNEKDFQWQLDTWLGDLSKNEQAVWSNHIKLLKARTKNGRVPEKVAGIRLSERMSKIVERCAEKQAALDVVFMQEAKKIRDAYVSRANTALATASDAEKKSLELRIKLSADLDSWVQTVGSVVSAKAPSASFTIISANYGTGGKNADVTERVRKLILEEQRVFWVNPGDLGADPNPGWNKGLTIKYEANGVEGKKSWGENSKVDFVDLMKEATADQSSMSGPSSNPFGTPVAPGSATDPIVGPWRWGGGDHATYTFSADGTVRVGSGEGKWKLVSKAGTKREYEVTWGGQGIVDTVAIVTGKPDYFEGTNSNGQKISATRILQ